MSANAKIPATVITGFLGAGKTSMIRHLLENAQGRKLALIINEFGDIGVDAEMLKCGEAGCAEGDVVELTNGCICCTVADDFLPTIQALIDRADPPDHIVIETSGLALPKPLIKAFSWPEIRTKVTVDGVIAVVDGAALADGLFVPEPASDLDHESPIEELFEEQVQCADMVILNKSDLLDDGELSRVTAIIEAHLRPAVHIHRASHGAVEAEILLGLDAGAEDDLDTRPSHHDGGGDHEHDDFSSLIVDLGEVSSPRDVIDRLRPVIEAHDVLRIKGFVSVAGKGMRLVVQGVGGRLNHYYDRDWRDGEARKSHLVVIGEKGLDEAAVRHALEA